MVNLRAVFKTSTRDKPVFHCFIFQYNVILNSIDSAFGIYQMIHGLQEVIMMSLKKPILDQIVNLRRALLAVHVALCKKDYTLTPGNRNLSIQSTKFIGLSRSGLSY